MSDICPAARVSCWTSASSRPRALEQRDRALSLEERRLEVLRIHADKGNELALRKIEYLDATAAQSYQIVVRGQVIAAVVISATIVGSFALAWYGKTAYWLAGVLLALGAPAVALITGKFVDRQALAEEQRQKKAEQLARIDGDRGSRQADSKHLGGWR